MIELTADTYARTQKKRERKGGGKEEGEKKGDKVKKRRKRNKARPGRKARDIPGVPENIRNIYKSLFISNQFLFKIEI